MPRNAHRPGASASQSFRAEDVAFLDELCTLLSRGADVSILARNPAFTRLRAKVHTMQLSIERQRRSAEGNLS